MRLSNAKSYKIYKRVQEGEKMRFKLEVGVYEPLRDWGYFST